MKVKDLKIQANLMGVNSIKSLNSECYQFVPYRVSDKTVTAISQNSVTLSDVTGYAVGGNIIIFTTPCNTFSSYTITQIDVNTITLEQGIGTYFYGAGSFVIYEDNPTPQQPPSLTIAIGECIASGKNTIAIGSALLDAKCIASGDSSQSFGIGTKATDVGAHAQGYNTEASAPNAHAQGYNTEASAHNSHAEGSMTKALSDNAHAEGFATEASAPNSHAEGSMTKALMGESHAEGYATEAAHSRGHAGGSGSKTTANNDFVRGNTGSSASTANNIFRIHGDTGNVTADGAFTGGGADYAETFEWADGNPQKEDRVGLFVQHDGEKIAIFNGGILSGIVSAAPAVVGDAQYLKWRGIFQLDNFGRKIKEQGWTKSKFTPETENPIPVDVYKDSEGNVWKYHPSPSNVSPIPFDEDVEVPENLVWSPYSFNKINPELDTTKEYVPRLERQEWDAIGMLGKLRVMDDGTAIPGGYIKPVNGGSATVATAEDAVKFYVLKRISDTVIEVLFK